MQQKVELCLNCLDFPCTCGKQYRNLKDYQLEEIIITIQDLLQKRGHQVVSCIVDGLDIAKRKEIDADKDVPLFEKDELPNLVSQNILSDKWIDCLNNELTLDILWNKLAKKNPDDFPLPGLFMLVIYLKYLDITDIIMPGTEIAELLDKIIHTFLKESPIEMFINQMPKEVVDRTFKLHDTQFVEVMKQTQDEQTAKVAEQIYNIYRDIYDAHVTFDHMVFRFSSLFAIIAGISDISNYLSPVLLQTKYSDDLYYQDIELTKMLVSLDLNFIINPLID